MGTKTVYEWALETVTADDDEDILNIHHSTALKHYSAQDLHRAMTGERFGDEGLDPERETQFFLRLALTKKVYEGPDEYDDLLWMDYAYVNSDGEFDEYDDAGGLPPAKYRKELLATVGQIN
jgi:hypothetical protein